jgi:arylsulfatase A-like enzyme
MHWPAGLGAERRDVDGLFEMVDVLPTMLGLCGAHVPDMMIGRSMAEGLTAGAKVEGREDALAYMEPGVAMLRTEKWKYLRYGPGREVLYDLAEDPPEVTNRAGDPGCADTLAELRDRMLTRVLQASRTHREELHPW